MKYHAWNLGTGPTLTWCRNNDIEILGLSYIHGKFFLVLFHMYYIYIYMRTYIHIYIYIYTYIQYIPLLAHPSERPTPATEVPRTRGVFWSWRCCCRSSGICRWIWREGHLAMGMAWGRWKRYEKIRGKLKRRFFFGIFFWVKLDKWHFGKVGTDRYLSEARWKIWGIEPELLVPAFATPRIHDLVIFSGRKTH